jgi:hypothetical protein
VPQNWQLRFGDLGLKITMAVSWFVPQNQACFGLSVAAQNRWREDGVGHASKSSGLLRLEACRARVFQFDLKTGVGVTTVVHVTPSQRLRRDQVEDGRVDATGCVGPCYSYFAIFYILDPRSIVVF